MPKPPKKPTLFPETSWSLVGRAAAPDDAIRQAALTELLIAYQPGLRAFLITARKIAPDQADEILQAFIADKVLAAGMLRHADADRGKFRNFIMKSLSHFASTKLKRRSVQGEREGISYDESVLNEPVAAPAVDRFEQEWVRQVVRDALHSMEEDCKGRGRLDMWEVFRLRVVDPLLNGTEAADYDQIVRQLKIKTAREATNLLANAKRCFLTHLKAAVGKYVARDQIDQELSDLRNIVDR